MHFLALTLPFLSLITAAVTPTSPDGATVVRAGGQMTALWNADTTGTWQNTTIQLMTGDNLQMVPLKVLASGIDGTTTTSWTGPVPAVSPNSKIYFLQFTRGGDVTTATWTTRWTIADANGGTTPPTNSTVYNGQTVQWGTGVLLDSSNSTSTSNSTTSASSSAAVIASSASSAASSASAAVVTSASSASAARSSTSASTSASSASAAAASTSRSSADRITAGWGMAALGLIGAAIL